MPTRQRMQHRQWAKRHRDKGKPRQHSFARKTQSGRPSSTTLCYPQGRHFYGDVTGHALSRSKHSMNVSRPSLRER